MNVSTSSEGVVVCQKEALAKFANTSSSHSWWWQKVCLSPYMHMFANDALYILLSLQLGIPSYTHITKCYKTLLSFLHSVLAKFAKLLPLLEQFLNNIPRVQFLNNISNYGQECVVQRQYLSTIISTCLFFCLMTPSRHTHTYCDQEAIGTKTR